MTTLYVITHGEHQKGGDTAKTYDGPLTVYGVEQVTSLRKRLAANSEIQKVRPEHVYCGALSRHRATLSILDIETNGLLHPELGTDTVVFDLLANQSEEFLTRFLRFLERVRAEVGDRPTLFIASRIVPITMFYLQNGGEPRFGHLAHFVNACDSIVKPEHGRVSEIDFAKQAHVTCWAI